MGSRARIAPAPITATSSMRKLRDEALLRHLRAADADVAHAAAPALVQRRHQLGAERVARVLAGDDEQPQVLALGRDRSALRTARPASAVIGRSCSAPLAHAASHNTRNRPRSSASRRRILVGGRARVPDRSRRCRRVLRRAPARTGPQAHCRQSSASASAADEHARPCASAGPTAAAAPPRARAWRRPFGRLDRAHDSGAPPRRRARSRTARGIRPRQGPSRCRRRRGGSGARGRSPVRSGDARPRRQCSPAAAKPARP